MPEQLLDAERGVVSLGTGPGKRTATLLSVSAELPEGRLTTAELAERFGISEEWIISRTGIRERCRAAPDERLTDYAIRAGAAALERAGMQGRDLDLVIVATMTPDELTPNTAPLVAHALGAVQAGTFDVGAACTAFLTGLALGAGQIESGRADRVLLVGADFITRITDYDDKRSAPLFGDAAGAVMLGATGSAAAANERLPARHARRWPGRAGDVKRAATARRQRTPDRRRGRRR